MYCNNCGRDIDNDSIYCPYCGSEQSLNNTFYQNDRRYDNRNVYKPESKVIPNLALIFGIFGGVLGLVFAIIGLVTCKSSSSRVKCAIAIILFFVWLIVYFFVFVYFLQYFMQFIGEYFIYGYGVYPM